MDNSSPNMAIWTAASRTDPSHTKTFDKAARGFAGTSPNPTYLIMRATEQFGPVGKGWGWEVISEEIVTGHKLYIKDYIEGKIRYLKDKDGLPIDSGTRALAHYVQVRVWWTDGKEKYYTGPQFGGTMLTGSDARGVWTDDDGKKKSITDALKKCLVCLGFSADIHMGLYDDDKYVAEMERHFSGVSDTNKHGQQRASAPRAQATESFE